MRSSEFDSRVVAYIPYLRGLAKKFERDILKREDLVQETLASILAKHDTFREDGGFVLWITFQMRAILSDARRKKNLIVEDPDGKYAAAVWVAPTQEDHVYAREVVQALPEISRSAIVMRGMGMMHREIGAMEGVSAQTIHMRIKSSQKAIEELR